MNNKFVEESGFDSDKYAFFGNKFLIGNGYMGVRGTMSEFKKEYLPAVNLAGVYDKAGEGWRESVNAPNGLYAYVMLDNKKYALPDSKAKSHLQRLDIYNGILYRETVFETEKGGFEIKTERAASMADKHLLLERMTLKADFDCSASVFTGIDADVWDINGPHFKKIVCADNGCGVKAFGTTGEKNIEVTVKTRTKCGFEARKTVHISDSEALEEFTFDMRGGSEYTIDKVISVYTSEDGVSEREAGEFSRELECHKRLWNRIADDSYIEIEGDDEAELNLNYSLYHLNCIAPRHSKSLSIPARGLSGQVYKGAVFWDTEMFMLDYFLYNFPEIARTLIMYRVDTLDGALKKAADYGLEGAFYAWESQEGGFDACSDYNVVDVFTKRPMRTFFKDKQVHISAAVVYAAEKYIKATGDDSVLKEGAARVILECARFYRSLLIKRAVSDKYEIWDVIGPDEYHERVNNNAYTNRMAKFVFETVCKYKDYFETDVSEYAELAERLYIPEPDGRGVIEQFDGYFKLEDCSIESVRSRLLDPKEYWGGAYGVASHTQVIKQADAVAMMCMFKEDFDKRQMQANLDYYEPRTEHGSSLSACMYSLLNCYVKNPDKAYPFFMKSAGADMRPGGKEWAGLIYIGGTHPASEGGAWMVAVRGFAGFDIENGRPVCRPSLPSKWKKMKFNTVCRNKKYTIEIEGENVSITEKGEPA